MSKEKLPRSEESEVDLRRRASRILLKASKKRRESLVHTLTRENSKAFEDLLDLEPLFYEDDQESEKLILIDPEIEELLPNEFYESPTEWIEAQSVINRGEEANRELPKGEKIDELLDYPYDRSKVREFSLGEEDQVQIVSKRIEKEEVNEITRAKEAYAKGVPTPKVLAEIYDRGNTYAWFEKIAGKDLVNIISLEKWSLFSASESTSLSALRDLLEARGYPPESHNDFINLWTEYKDFFLARGFLSLLGAIVLNVARLNRGVGGTRGLVDIRACRSLDDFRSIISGFTGSEEHSRVLSTEEVNSGTLVFGKDVWSRYYSIFEKIRRSKNVDKADKLLRIETKSLIDEKFKEKRNEYVLRWQEMAQKLFLGFVVDELINKLERELDKVGIKHKDLDYRNIVIETDPDTEEIVFESPGLPKAYIIDWEER